MEVRDISTIDIKTLYLRTNFNFNLESGGSVAHTAGVINALDEKVELTILSNDKLSGVGRKIQILQPSLTSIFPTFINELLYSFKLIKYYYNTRYNYRIIYQRFSGGSFAGAYLAKKYNSFFILEYNSSDIWRLKNWKGKSIRSSIIKRIYQYLIYIPIYRIIESYCFHNAKIIIVVSEVMKNNLVQQGVPEDKILYNPNGANPNKYHPNIDSSRIRDKYKLQDKNVVGFIGTFGEWHGIMEMCEAIKLFFENDFQKDTIFILIGDGVLFSQSKDYFKDCNYKENIIFTGSVDQEKAPEYLAACDIYLSPHIENKDGSIFFGSPTKLFEYMAMGKAIIASDLGQIGEVIQHKQTGYKVPPGDSTALANAIKHLIDNKSLRIKIGQNARIEILNKYTWDKNIERLLNAAKI